MSVKLLTKHLLEILSLKKAAHARLSLHLSKCHIVGKHMSRLIFIMMTFLTQPLIRQPPAYHSQFISLSKMALIEV